MVDISAEQVTADDDADIPSAALMVLPIVTMVAMMPIGLYITGDGNLIAGSGIHFGVVGSHGRDRRIVDHAAWSWRQLDQ